jgi:uncharacterized membrane protein YidH (DUF202 family)
MSFCGNCGAKNDDTSTFCQDCGTKLNRPIDTTDNVNYGEYNQSSKPIYSQPINQYSPEGGPRYTSEFDSQNVGPRSYLNWIIIFIFTLGIGSIVYKYYNFNDLRKVNDRHPELHQKHKDPLLMVILYYVVAPIASMFIGFGFLVSFFIDYFKYNDLRSHLIKFHGQTTNLPIPGLAIFFYLCLSIVIFIAFIISIFMIAFGELSENIYYLILLAGGFWIIGYYYFEYKWQMALNAHIEYHNSI